MIDTKPSKISFRKAILISIAAVIILSIIGGFALVLLSYLSWMGFFYSMVEPSKEAANSLLALMCLAVPVIFLAGSEVLQNCVYCKRVDKWHGPQVVSHIIVSALLVAGLSFVSMKGIYAVVDSGRKMSAIQNGTAPTPPEIATSEIPDNPASHMTEIITKYNVFYKLHDKGSSGFNSYEIMPQEDYDKYNGVCAEFSGNMHGEYDVNYHYTIKLYVSEDGFQNSFEDYVNNYDKARLNVFGDDDRAYGSWEITSVDEANRIICQKWSGTSNNVKENDTSWIIYPSENYIIRIDFPGNYDLNPTKEMTDETSVMTNELASYLKTARWDKKSVKDSIQWLRSYDAEYQYKKFMER